MQKKPSEPTNLEPKPHPYRCQKHRMWMKRGHCELCCLERDALKKENELLGGSNKPKVFIRKI
ncbi:hypothetical protein UFOVP248_29 [uncultured Caudovirales phage]|uniref:Uncharacterized protein n=1 Tax=uncultured Caudovirales phage TaxID=2100421 RepID=A0A6J5LCP4_9CAUD|nr:hypothetical protein UFOVP248_29 [uncultured Caudovirales phage]